MSKHDEKKDKKQGGKHGKGRDEKKAKGKDKKKKEAKQETSYWDAKPTRREIKGIMDGVYQDMMMLRTELQNATVTFSLFKKSLVDKGIISEEEINETIASYNEQVAIANGLAEEISNGMSMEEARVVAVERGMKESYLDLFFPILPIGNEHQQDNVVSVDFGHQSEQESPSQVE